jgi:hypothetical protein
MLTITGCEENDFDGGIEEPGLETEEPIDSDPVMDTTPDPDLGDAPETMEPSDPSAYEPDPLADEPEMDDDSPQPNTATPDAGQTGQQPGSADASGNTGQSQPQDEAQGSGGDTVEEVQTDSLPGNPQQPKTGSDGQGSSTSGGNQKSPNEDGGGKKAGNSQ